MVKANLLDRLRSDRSVAVCRAATGIGAYLESAEMPKLVDAVVNEIAYGTSSDRDGAVRILIDDAWQSTSEEGKKKLSARLGTWISLFQSKGHAGHADTVDKLRASMEDADELPF